jgi:hypothetical protein
VANAQQPGSPLMLSLRSYMSEQGCLCISRLFAATKYRLAGQLVVDAPLRREEQADRFEVGVNRALIRLRALVSSGAAWRQYLSVSQNRPWQTASSGPDCPPHLSP